MRVNERRLVYLTYGESPSGVYASQVVDVCRFLQAALNREVRLVAFVSPRTWSVDRRRIGGTLPESIVLPALPTVSSRGPSLAALATVCAAIRPAAIVARSIPATNMALVARRLGLARAVCLDGRGAVAAEREEYLGARAEQIRRFRDLERTAVMDADARIAVSTSLVGYWRTEYGYASDRHVVIPCTLPTDVQPSILSDKEIAQTRMSLGIAPDSTVMAYSGSASGWQSFSAIEKFLERILPVRADCVALFLSPPSPEVSRLEQRFEGRVIRRHLPQGEVARSLEAADFGIMIRESSVTNAASSPTKLAEYLAAGLPVVISPGIGDYSRFVEEHGCGKSPEAITPASLVRPSIAERRRIAALARSLLSKHAFRDRYLSLLAMLDAPANRRG